MVDFGLREAGQSSSRLRAPKRGLYHGCGPSKHDKDAIKPPSSDAGKKWKYDWPKGADPSGPLTEKGIKARIEKWHGARRSSSSAG